MKVTDLIARLENMVRVYGPTLEVEVRIPSGGDWSGMEVETFEVDTEERQSAACSDIECSHVHMQTIVVVHP